MGLNDDREMLVACREQSTRDEHEIAALKAKLDAIRALCTDDCSDATLERDGERGVYVDSILPILDA